MNNSDYNFLLLAILAEADHRLKCKIN